MINRILILVLLFLLIPSFSFALSDSPRTYNWIDPATVRKTVNRGGLNYSLMNEAGKSYVRQGAGLATRGATWKPLMKLGKATPFGKAATLLLMAPAIYEVAKNGGKGAGELVNDFVGFPLIEDAVNKALNPNNVNRAANIGEGESRCGETYVLVEKRLYGASCCSSSELYDRDDSCTRRVSTVEEAQPQCVVSSCVSPARPLTTYVYIYEREVESDSPTDFPEQLSDQQAQRLLDEIEKRLQSHREAMEQELDKLMEIKPDIVDWPQISDDEMRDAYQTQEIDDLVQGLTDAQDALRNDPNNQELKDQVEQLQRRLEELGRDINRDQLDSNREGASVPEVELKSIDFQPIVDLKGELLSKFPFNLLTAFGGALDVLTADPVAPKFEINLGFGDPIVCDLAVFDSIASFFRGVMSFLIFGACGFFCFKMWSRF